MTLLAIPPLPVLELPPLPDNLSQRGVTGESENAHNDRSSVSNDGGDGNVQDGGGEGGVERVEEGKQHSDT